MSVPNRPESEYNAALKMWGGKWGAAIPLLLLICGLLWLSLHGPATPKNFWSIGFAATRPAFKAYGRNLSNNSLDFPFQSTSFIRSNNERMSLPKMQ